MNELTDAALTSLLYAASDAQRRYNRIVKRSSITTTSLSLLATSFQQVGVKLGGIFAFSNVFYTTFHRDTSPTSFQQVTDSSM